MTNQAMQTQEKLAAADLAGKVLTAMKPSDLCNLKVSRVPLGTEVTFTIPKGMSGRDILELIEKTNNARLREKEMVWPQASLQMVGGLDTKVTEDTHYTFTLCEESCNKTRSEQEAYLAENNLTTVPSFVLKIGSALFRDREGFSEDWHLPQQKNDKGDLFKCKWIRAGSCYRKPFEGQGFYVESYGECGGGCQIRDVVAADYLIIAGAPLTNQKS